MSPPVAKLNTISPCGRREWHFSYFDPFILRVISDMSDTEALSTILLNDPLNDRDTVSPVMKSKPHSIIGYYKVP